MVWFLRVNIFNYHMDTPMIKALKEYLLNTSQEQKNKDWTEIKALGLKGPTPQELI